MYIVFFMHFIVKMIKINEFAYMPWYNWLIKLILHGDEFGCYWMIMNSTSVYTHVHWMITYEPQDENTSNSIKDKY